MAKTLSFGVMHMSIAFAIGYALTGDLLISGATTLIEPVANTIAFHFFDKFWGRQPRWLARWSKSKAHQPVLLNS